MNIYPAEIEHLLLARVTDVALIGHVVGEVGRVPAGRDRRCRPGRGKLAGYELPRRAVFTVAIHRTPTGKALKRVLREQFPLDAPE